MPRRPKPAPIVADHAAGLDLTIENLPLAAITEYAGNSRQHSVEQIDLICKSIREYGFTSPVLIDGNNELIAGHARLQAAQRLKMTAIPTIRLAYLSPEQKRALVIADNKIAQTGSQWDYPQLKLELLGLSQGGFDLDKTGFSLEEVTKLFNPLPDLDARPERHIQATITCPNCGHIIDG